MCGGGAHVVAGGGVGAAAGRSRAGGSAGRGRTSWRKARARAGRPGTAALCHAHSACWRRRVKRGLLGEARPWWTRLARRPPAHASHSPVDRPAFGPLKQGARVRARCAWGTVRPCLTQPTSSRSLKLCAAASMACSSRSTRSYASTSAASCAPSATSASCSCCASCAALQHRRRHRAAVRRCRLLRPARHGCRHGAARSTQPGRSGCGGGSTPSLPAPNPLAQPIDQIESNVQTEGGAPGWTARGNARPGCMQGPGAGRGSPPDLQVQVLEELPSHRGAVQADHPLPVAAGRRPGAGTGQGGHRRWGGAWRQGEGQEGRHVWRPAGAGAEERSQAPRAPPQTARPGMRAHQSASPADHMGEPCDGQQSWRVLGWGGAPCSPT